jgi:hypothetical protein
VWALGAEGLDEVATWETASRQRTDAAQAGKRRSEAMGRPHDDGNGPADDLGRRVLEEHPEFQLVLLDGQRWSCSLLAWGRHELLVRTANGRYLVPQHAIAYVVLEEEIGPELAERNADAATAILSASELAEAAEPSIPAVFTATEERPDPPIP